MRRVALVLAAAFAALTTLVWTGVLTGLDQWAVDNVMPGVSTEPPRPLLEQLIPYTHHPSVLDIVADTVILPGHPALSLALAVWLAWAMPRRRVAIVVGFLVTIALEVAFKHVVTRAPLDLHGFHLRGFDDSFPSGHAARTVFLGVLALAAFPRQARWIALWLAAILVLLVVGGFHTPSDVAGGVLLGTLLGLLARQASPAASSSTARGRD